MNDGDSMTDELLSNSVRPGPLWQSGDVAAALGCRLFGAADIPLGGVSIDSRTIDDGDIFFAISGDRFDGHDFVASALKQGAALAVISKDNAPGIEADPSRLLVVDDVLESMEDLGRAARARLAGRVIAVTGSVGKTGTKEMMRLTFGNCGLVHASIASFNNHWGVPLTLSRMPRHIDYGIYEIGMNHPGEIVPLVGMVRPHLAIITTVEPVHLEFFADESEIARAKAEIFTGIEPGGKAILNCDNRHFGLLAELARDADVEIVKFGIVPDADVRLSNVELYDDHSLVSAQIFGSPVQYTLGAPGRHLVQNSLAVAAALYLTGTDIEAGLAALSTLRAAKGRGARLTLQMNDGACTVLDESYNANPASMGAAIGLLGKTNPEEGGRRIAVLGDMLELGEQSGALHEALASLLLQAEIDMVFLSGTHMEALWDALPHKMRGKYTLTSDGLHESLVQTVAKGDILMVKGSLGSRMGPLVETLISHYTPINNDALST